MMKRMRSLCLAALLFLAAGCEKPGPVSLFDPSVDKGDLHVLVNPNVSAGAFGTEDIDSAHLFPPVQGRVLGQLIVSGSVFDSKTGHHEGSLTRAIFFDRSSPVIINGDTLAYKTLNAGVVSIDAIPLFPREKRLQIPQLSLDTLLGIQYSLVSVDGIGGRGFQYLGGHAYRWTGTGLGSIAPFTIDVQSPPLIHVDSPTPDQTVSLSHNLTVKWTGGGSYVDILISDVQAGVRARPLVRLRLAANRGETVIPSAVLQILRGRPSALFSFTSGSRSTVQVAGYPDDVAATTASTHNLLLTLGP
jgi:hypothetical protein